MIAIKVVGKPLLYVSINILLVSLVDIEAHRCAACVVRACSIAYDKGRHAECKDSMSYAPLTVRSSDDLLQPPDRASE